MMTGRQIATRISVTAGSVATVMAGLTAVRISWQVRAWTSAHGWDTTVIDHATDDLTGHPWQFRAAGVDWIVGVAVILVIALVWLYKLSETWDRRPGAEYGSAAWGRPRDLAGLAHRDAGKNILITRHVRLSTDAITASPENQRNCNILCVGGSGLGKTRNFIEPNLAHGQASLVVTDPKGEIYATAAADLRRRGYKVRRLDLITMDRSDGFNPLIYLRPGNQAEDIEQLAKTIISNTTGPKPTGGDLDPFWERAEQALLTAMMAYVVACYRPADRNLPQVARLLDKVTTADRRGLAEDTDAMFADAQAGRVTCENPDVLAYAISRYHTFKMAHPKTASSILLCAGVRLSLLAIPAVSQIMSYDSLILDQMGSEPTAVFVMMPDVTDAFAFVTSLFFQVLFETLFRIADTRPGGRLEVPVQCWMDEFPNLGVIPMFHQRVATMRSRYISAQIFVQNVGQLAGVYGDKPADTIRGNCDTLVFLGTSDMATAKDISERLGKQTIVSVNTSEQRGGHGGASRSRQSLGRDLLSPDEVLQMSRRDAIVMISGKRPVRDQKLPAPQLANNYTVEVSQ